MKLDKLNISKKNYIIIGVVVLVVIVPVVAVIVVICHGTLLKEISGYHKV